MQYFKFSWGQPLTVAALAAGLWLLNPPQWTFHYYLIQFFREQSTNRQILEEERIDYRAAKKLATQAAPVRIEEKDIIDVVYKLKPRVWDLFFFQLIKVDIKQVTLTFVGAFGNYHFFVADSLEPFDELALVRPGEVDIEVLEGLTPYTPPSPEEKITGTFKQKPHWSEAMDPELRRVFYDGYAAAYQRDHPGELPAWMNPYRRPTQPWAM